MAKLAIGSISPAVAGECAAALEAAGLRLAKSVFNSSVVPMAGVLLEAGLGESAALRWAAALYIGGHKTASLRRAIADGFTFVTPKGACISSKDGIVRTHTASVVKDGLRRRWAARLSGHLSPKAVAAWAQVAADSLALPEATELVSPTGASYLALMGEHWKVIRRS